VRGRYQAVPCRQQRNEWLVRFEAAAIVQEQDRGAFTGVEQFEFHASNRDDMPLHGHLRGDQTAL
jgi:hypothetical protein